MHVFAILMSKHIVFKISNTCLITNRMRKQRRYSFLEWHRSLFKFEYVSTLTLNARVLLEYY